MGRINTKEFYGVFPCNKYEVNVYSNDHNPPHFHVCADGWNVRASIETGKIIGVKSFGNSTQIYNFVEKNAELWLNKKSAKVPKQNNREVAMNEWNKGSNKDD